MDRATLPISARGGFCRAEATLRQRCVASFILSPTNTARNFGVMIDNGLTFTEHIAAVTKSCRFTLYNIRKIRPYLILSTTPHTSYGPVQTRLLQLHISRSPCMYWQTTLDDQNAEARLIFSQPKRAHVTPLLASLHWLPFSQNQFQNTGSAPSYLSELIQPYTPARSLRSSEERLLYRADVTTRSQSRLFAFILPQWWNEMPNSIRSATSLDSFKKHLKTHLFTQTLTCLRDLTALTTLNAFRALYFSFFI